MPDRKFPNLFIIGSMMERDPSGAERPGRVRDPKTDPGTHFATALVVRSESPERWRSRGRGDVIQRLFDRPAVTPLGRPSHIVAAFFPSDLP